MIKDIIPSEMGFTLWNVAAMLIYRWNGLLPRTQSPPYNNVLIISSFKKRILKQKTLILPSGLFKPNCEVIHTLILFSGIFTDQLFMAIATPDLRG